MLFIPEEGSISVTDSENVIIFPLLQEEMQMLIDDQSYFENYINLKYLADSVKEKDGFFQKQLNLLKNTENSYPWLSIWAITSVKDRAIVGSINFKNIPNQKLEVEIAYFVNENFRNKNFATTAVELICAWALKNGINCVKANVNKSNFASQKVLEKNSFKKKENKNYFTYKKEFYEKS